MTALRDKYTVDADGHGMEPADLWLRYLEPEYRDRALQIKVDADGLESLYVEGRPMHLMHGTLGALGGIEARDAAAKQEFQTPGARTYAEGCPTGGYDPRARLAVMDSEGIDAALLYPTIGNCWEGPVEDPALATDRRRARVPGRGSDGLGFGLPTHRRVVRRGRRDPRPARGTFRIRTAQGSRRETHAASTG